MKVSKIKQAIANIEEKIPFEDPDIAIHADNSIYPLEIESVEWSREYTSILLHSEEQEEMPKTDPNLPTFDIINYAVDRAGERAAEFLNIWRRADHEEMKEKFPDFEF